MSTETGGRVHRLLVGLLGVLMLWAAVSKLANPTDFLGSIYAYQLPLPKGLLQATAVVLPWLELLCGLLLVAGLWADTALLLLTSLLVVFVLATGQAWLRGIEIGCGCFSLEFLGLSRNFSGVERFLESVAFAFFRNLALVTLVAFLLRKALRSPSPIVRANDAH